MIAGYKDVYVCIKPVWETPFCRYRLCGKNWLIYSFLIMYIKTDTQWKLLYLHSAWLIRKGSSRSNLKFNTIFTLKLHF
jgi:hypothetical protein